MHFVYSHGYAVPDYVEAEPKIPRGGVFRTKYARRRSYDDLRSGFSLGSDEGGGGPDPISDFGQKSAKVILRETMKLPPGDRRKALKAALDEVDPKVWGRTDARALALRAEGVPPLAALEQSMAEALSLGLLEEFARVGKTGEVKPKSMLGIGMHGPGLALAGYSQAMGGLGSFLGSFGSTVVKTVGSLACTAANSPAGPAAAFVAGGPAAAGGAQMLANSCGGGQQQAYYPPPQPQQSMLPILLIGGAILAAVLLTRPQ